MYILWSKEEFNGKYILFAKNTLDELKQTYNDFCEKNKEEYDFDTLLKEKELDSFSSYSHDYDFYYSEIKNVDANKPIYIFIFHEDGEGGNYHDEMYFSISNDKEKLLEIATDNFMLESRKTEKENIDEMINSLRTKGEYDIPYGRTYVCDMKIFEFSPYEL